MKKIILAAVAAVTLALGAVATQAIAAPAPAAPQSAPAGLAGARILLSNDDSMQAARPNGADGLGLYEVRRALCAAGADVVVVAPWANQSGASMAVTNSGAVTAERRTALPSGFKGDCAEAPSGGAVFGLCRAASTCAPGMPSATPADTVKFALRGGLKALVGWQGAPDLVVTGMNSGPNVSSSVNDSGTIGAAIAAIDSRVPAVALSAGIDANLAVARETYTHGADYAADFIGRMLGEGLLGSDFVVNVNYPDATGGKAPTGVEWTRVGDGSVAVHSYTPQGGSTFAIGLGLCPAAEYCEPETRADADSTALFAGKVTVSAITRDRTLVTHEANTLRALITSGGHQR